MFSKLNKYGYFFPSLLIFSAAFFLVPLFVNGQQILTIPSGDNYTVQVGDGTSLNDFKIHFTEIVGAGIDDWYDVNDAASPSAFGPELTYDGTACTYKNLINLNLTATTDFTDSCDTSGNRLTVLENSPTRTIFKGTNQLATWGTAGAGDANWQMTTTYTAYANGRIYGDRTLTRLNTSSNSMNTYYPLRIFTDYNTNFAAGDESLDNLVSATQYTAHNLDDYWMFHSNTGTTVGDVAMTPYTDWAPADYMIYNLYSATAQLRVGLRDNGPRTWAANDSDNFKFMLQIKPSVENGNNRLFPNLIRGGIRRHVNRLQIPEFAQKWVFCRLCMYHKNTRQ